MHTRFLGDDLWHQIARFGHDNPKILAVAYVSDARNFRFSKGDEIITNASPEAIMSAQTSASLLLNAAIAGARVYALKDLHAKVLLTSKAALIGSANLSGSSRNLKEAAVITTDPRIVVMVRRYLQSLRRQAKYLTLDELKRLAKLPVIRAPRIASKTAPPKPSLLSALRSDSKSLDDLGFIWYCTGGELTTKTVRKHASRRDIPLPSGARWEWYESIFHTGAIKLARKHFLNRPVASWEVELNKDKSGLTRFKPHDSYAAPFIDAFRLDDYLVEIVGTTPFRTSIDLRRDRRALARILTAGLKRNPNLCRAINAHPLGIITSRQLRRLYELGKNAA